MPTLSQSGTFRFITALTLAAFTATNFFSPGLYAAPPPRAEEAPSAVPQIFSPSLIKVPAELGKIQDTHAAPHSKTTVLLVQDAHAIPQAQRSIQRLIQYFQKEHSLEHVALEGVRSRLDPQIFRSFPDPELLREVFEAYFEKGELTASTAAAIFNETPPHFHGAEDWDLYELGLSLYLKALQNETTLLEKFGALEKTLEAKKEKIYSAELLELDRTLKAFREKKANLVKLLKLLGEIRRPEKGSELALIIEEIERTGDEAEAERETEALAKKVKAHLKSLPATKETNEAIRSFNEKSQAFKTSQLPAGGFALFLKELAAKEGLVLKISKPLGRLLRNQRRIQRLEGLQFFRDLEAYILSVKEALFQNEAERTLDRESHELEVLHKLIRLELNREEWSEIREKLAAPQIEWLATRFAEFAPLLEPHLHFYENAVERDKAFVSRLERLAKENKAQLLLFIAGGFHTEGLTEELKERGISYLLIAPRFTSVPEKTNYRGHMKGEVSWKDYFQAENGKISVYRAFVRATRDRLLEASKDDPGRVLKTWRDEIIRDLAKENRISEAAGYTRFLDEVRNAEEEAVLAKQLKKIDEFVAKLRRLHTAGRLSEENILRLVPASPAGGRPSAAAEWSTYSVLDSAAFVHSLPSISSNFELPPSSLPFPRAEVRSDAPHWEDKSVEALLTELLGERLLLERIGLTSSELDELENVAKALISEGRIRINDVFLDTYIIKIEDGKLWINKKAWDEFSDLEAKAWLLHELIHLLPEEARRMNDAYDWHERAFGDLRETIHTRQELMTARLSQEPHGINYRLALNHLMHTKIMSEAKAYRSQILYLQLSGIGNLIDYWKALETRSKISFLQKTYSFFPNFLNPEGKIDEKKLHVVLVAFIEGSGDLANHRWTLAFEKKGELSWETEAQYEDALWDWFKSYQDRRQRTSAGTAGENPESSKRRAEVRVNVRDHFEKLKAALPTGKLIKSLFSGDTISYFEDNPSGTMRLDINLRGKRLTFNSKKTYKYGPETLLGPLFYLRFSPTKTSFQMKFRSKGLAGSTTYAFVYKRSNPIIDIDIKHGEIFVVLSKDFVEALAHQHPFIKERDYIDFYMGPIQFLPESHEKVSKFRTSERNMPQIKVVESVFDLKKRFWATALEHEGERLLIRMNETTWQSGGSFNKGVIDPKRPMYDVLLNEDPVGYLGFLTLQLNEEGEVIGGEIDLKERRDPDKKWRLLLGAWITQLQEHKLNRSHPFLKQFPSRVLAGGEEPIPSGATPIYRPSRAEVRRESGKAERWADREGIITSRGGGDVGPRQIGPGLTKPREPLQLLWSSQRPPLVSGAMETPMASKRNPVTKTDTLIGIGNSAKASPTRPAEMNTTERLSAHSEIAPLRPSLKNSLSGTQGTLAQNLEGVNLARAEVRSRQEAKRQRGREEKEKGRIRSNLGGPKSGLWKTGLADHRTEKPAGELTVGGVYGDQPTNPAHGSLPLLVRTDLAFKNKSAGSESGNEIPLGKGETTQGAGWRNAEGRSVPGKSGRFLPTDGEAGATLQGSRPDSNQAIRETAPVEGRDRVRFPDPSSPDSFVSIPPSSGEPPRGILPERQGLIPDTGRYGGPLQGDRNTVTRLGRFSSTSGVPHTAQNLSPNVEPVNQASPLRRAEVRAGATSLRRGKVRGERGEPTSLLPLSSSLSPAFGRAEVREAEPSVEGIATAIVEGRLTRAKAQQVIVLVEKVGFNELHGALQEAVRRRLEKRLSRDEILSARIPQEVFAQATRNLFNTLLPLKQGGGTIGFVLPESLDSSFTEDFLRAIGRTNVEGIVLAGRIPADLSTGLRAQGKHLQPVKVTRRVTLVDQAAIPMGILDELFQADSIAPSFLPFSIQWGNVRDPLVQDYVEALQVVALAHTADLLRERPELLKDRKLLRAELLKRLSMEGFDSVITEVSMGGNFGFSLSAQVAQIFLEHQASLAAERAA